MVTHDLIKKIKNGMYDETLKDIYVDEKKIAYERERYIKAIESYTEHFGEGEVFVFSAPGRSEIGGNHTDHQCGEVLAASINNDAIAIVQNLEEPCVRVISAGYEMITIYLDDLCRREDEEATSGERHTFDEGTAYITPGTISSLKDTGVSKGLVVAGGDVGIDCDFEGLIISGGGATVKLGGTYKEVANTSMLVEILDWIKKDDTWKEFFYATKDKNKKEENVAECIGYENWTMN